MKDQEEEIVSHVKKKLKKGGFTASIFILVLLALESLSFVANMSSLVLYFIIIMSFNLSAAANTLTNFIGSVFFLTLVGGFISDTYLTRFTTCLCFGLLEVAGLVMMTIQARYDDLHPNPCGESSCVTGGVALMFYASLSLLAIGTGGAKGNVAALGGDQFDKKDPKEAKDLSSFFNWLLLSTVMGSIVGVTVVVWISINKSWYWGFFISTLSTFIGYTVLAIGKPFFRLDVPTESPLLMIAQVIVVAVNNRELSLLPTNELHENDEVSGKERLMQTKQFIWLDKAAIRLIDDNEGQQQSPWKVCTVTQVEQIKILIRMLPILGSTIIMNTCMAQLQTFSVQQGTMMNLRLGHLNIPPPSLPVIPLIFMVILIPVYEFTFVPFARKITHHPSGITQLQRVGVGLILSVISMGVAGIVEVKRRNEAKKGELISILWLGFQYGIFGIADMFTMVGLVEFFYKEAPVRMKSLSTSFVCLSMSFGYFLSSVLVSVINTVTKRMSSSKRGWLNEKDINQNKLDYFYWFLAVLSCLNMANYVYWASWYKYKKTEDQVNK